MTCEIWEGADSPNISYFAVTLVRSSPRTLHSGFFYEVAVEETSAALPNLVASHAPVMPSFAYAHLDPVSLKNENLPMQKVILIGGDIETEERKFVSALITLVMEANVHTQIPYGFSSFIDSIDLETGKCNFVVMGEGLTCATFVLGVFDALGLKFVDVENWPVTAADENWLIKFIKYLANKFGYDEQALTARAALPRFEPLAVSGAFLSQRGNWPLGRAASELNGNTLVKTYSL